MGSPTQGTWKPPPLTGWAGELESLCLGNASPREATQECWSWNSLKDALED